MNIILFSGFLGSGKTSVILNIAGHLAGNNKSDKPDLVIIENEVGETGIDEKILRSERLTVKELFAGCICCQLTSDLITTLNEIHADINPKWVIVEATGLAYPGKILEILDRYGKGIDNIKTITIVDAERWDELIEVTPVLIENQIKDADIILVNKIDLVNSNRIKHIEEKIRQLNPKAKFYSVNANQKENIIWKELI
jgi:G3E family GTPase